MNFVILNGVKSTLIKGLLIQSLPPISKPLMRTSIEQIDGRDGDVVTKLGYSAYDKQMSVGLFGDFDIDEVIKFFDSEGTVIFSNEPDKFYRYQIIQQIDFNKLLRFRTATVTFHVQPFKYSAVDTAFFFSKNRLIERSYETSGSGVEVKSHGGEITIKGTPSHDVQFYVPINAMTLEAGDYTLIADTIGSGESSCQIRVIESVPTDADSFGGQAITLSDSGQVTLQETLSASKTFNYVWISIVTGTALDFSLNVQINDEDTKSFKVFNQGNIKSRPTFTIFGSGTVVLSINSVEVFTINLANDGWITLDGLEMNAYKGDTLKNRSVSGDFNDLVLDVGTNIVSWTGNVERVEVYNETRWI